MKLKNRYLRMSDLANQPERPARNYTTEPGQQRTVIARPASRGITGFSAKHLYLLINNGQFPAPIKIGRASLWRVSDINQWLESHANQIDNQTNNMTGVNIMNSKNPSVTIEKTNSKSPIETFLANGLHLTRLTYRDIQNITCQQCCKQEMMHYFTFHPKDYMSKTNFLEPMEDLAYRRMLDYQYLNESPLPKDIDEIAMLINMRTHSESIATVLRYFFELTDDGYVNDRAEQEIAKYQEKSDKARKSANARWKKKGTRTNEAKDSSDDNANALQPQSEGNANQEPSTTNQEPSTSLSFDGFWSAYDYKKGGLAKPRAKWLSLDIETQKLIMAHVLDYVKSTPNKSYRKHPMTYLNNEGWLEEITESHNTDAEQTSSARPHSNRSDSFDSQPHAKSLSRDEQVTANKINMEKAGLKV